MFLFLRLIVVVFLTIVTQIGGVALIISWLLTRPFLHTGLYVKHRKIFPLAMFVASYTVLSVVIVPPFAMLGGRTPLSCNVFSSGNYAAANPLFCILNRHYVDFRLEAMLKALGRHMSKTYPGTRTLYLDANFPLFDGFPLMPHLSHQDGRKLDLAFYYTDESGSYLPGAVRSPIGYWAFEQPPKGGERCRGRAGFGLRWDMNWLQPLLPDLKLDEKRLRAAVNWMTSEGKAFGVQKLFLEPHLTRRLGISSPLLRFQGCGAARHDDHIHVQIRP